MEAEVVVVECAYDPPHTHEYPADWVFGGANGLDPRTDGRWQPVVYTYYDATLHPLHATVVPLCDDEAIDKFTAVAAYGPDFNPVFLSCRPAGGKEQMLPWRYDKEKDLVTPL